MVVSASSPIGICRACARRVRWAPTVNPGRFMPLNEDPDPAGKVYLDDFGVARVLRAGETAPVRYMPHFARCDHRGMTPRETQRALRRTREAVQLELLAQPEPAGAAIAVEEEHTISEEEMRELRGFIQRMAKGPRWR